MILTAPIAPAAIASNPKAEICYTSYKQLLEAVNAKSIPENTQQALLQMNEALNATSNDMNAWHKLLRKTITKAIALLAKEAKLSTPGYYRNLWMSVGMAAFGIPMGVAIGISVGNMGLLAIGLPIGLAIGMSVGSKMDADAKAKGLQLDVTPRCS